MSFRRRVSDVCVAYESGGESCRQRGKWSSSIDCGSGLFRHGKSLPRAGQSSLTTLVVPLEEAADTSSVDQGRIETS